MDVVNPLDAPVEAWRIAHWPTDTYFQVWDRRHAYKDSHAAIPPRRTPRLKLGRVTLRFFEHLSS